MSYDSDESWTILSPIEQSIKRKIEEIGTPLKNWNITINYGIKTGFNDSFIINGARKNELIAADPKSAEINSSLFSPLMMNASLNPVNIPRLILTSQSFNFMPILTIFPLLCLCKD